MAASHRYMIRYHPRTAAQSEEKPPGSLLGYKRVEKAYSCNLGGRAPCGIWVLFPWKLKPRSLRVCYQARDVPSWQQDGLSPGWQKEKRRSEGL